MSDIDPAAPWRDPETEADLAAERALPTASAAEREALYARVMATVSAPPPPSTPAGGALPWVVVTAALVGGAAWLALRGDPPDPGPPPAAVVQPSPPAPTVSADAQASRATAQSTIAAPEAAPPAPRPRRAPPSTLAAEQALLEAARRALAAGDADAALSSVRRHGARFADGRLAEERELLRVQALVRAGRLDAARAFAGAFRRDFPDSLLREALDVALAGSAAKNE